MERGDYSGAVRRVTTAIEVVVGAMVGSAIEAIDGKLKANKFLDKTKTNFNARVRKYEELRKCKLPAVLGADLKATRELRHSIVHKGYRIGPGERGRAQRAVDTGRWTFNWCENNPERQRIREKRIGFRSLGRDLSDGIFLTKITPEGVVVAPVARPR